MDVVNQLAEILDCMRRVELLKACDDYASVSNASKDKIIKILIELIVKCEIHIDDVLKYAKKPDIQSMCNILDLSDKGDRDDLEVQISDWLYENIDEPDFDEDSSDEDSEAETRDEFLEHYAYDPTLNQNVDEDWLWQRDAVRDVYRQLETRSYPQLLHVATGGGKTWIANDVLKRWLDEHGGWVYWVTKDWQLLKQASSDLCRRHDLNPMIDLARTGGDQKEIKYLPDDDKNQAGRARVLYSTLQTNNRRGGFLKLPSLVVWDECHWGIPATSGRKILQLCKKNKIRLLGLTATPKREAGGFEVAFSRTFSELVGKVLASPNIIRPILTNEKWTPKVRNYEYANESLRELAMRKKRNEIIVASYDPEKHGKTLVFACNIEHAETLTRLFSERRGVPVSVMHCDRPDRENRAVFEKFRRGDIKILVNVAKLTHGVDIPDIQTIFLTRPTLSEVLFSQMIGRGARLCKRIGKVEFNIVEFTDSVDRHWASLQQTAEKYFGGMSFSRPRQHQAPAAEARERTQFHSYDPKGEPRRIGGDTSVPDSMHGLWYLNGQTFGIEVELTRPGYDKEKVSETEWMTLAEPLRRSLLTVLPTNMVSDRPYFEYHAEEKDYSVWNVEYDRSCGWEITSRILSGRDGFLELHKACSALTNKADELGLKITYNTGLHIHIGWLGSDIGKIIRAIRLVKLFEPALGTLVSPSRLVYYDGLRYNMNKSNDYCKPVSIIFPESMLKSFNRPSDVFDGVREHDARYTSFNIKPYRDIHTVEVRLHNGTTEPRKILLWLSLWLQIMWAANNDTVFIPERIEDTNVIQPKGDIIDLVRRYLPTDQDLIFTRRLVARRKEIVNLWRENDQLRPWTMFSNSWRSL